MVFPRKAAFEKEAPRLSKAVVNRRDNVGARSWLASFMPPSEAPPKCPALQFDEALKERAAFHYGGCRHATS